jgi:Flp pilus assembly pilin Flp
MTAKLISFAKDNSGAAAVEYAAHAAGIALAVSPARNLGQRAL